MSLCDRYLEGNHLCVHKILLSIVYSQNNMLITTNFVNFLCSVISQGKTLALGEAIILLMTHTLTTEY